MAGSVGTLSRDFVLLAPEFSGIAPCFRSVDGSSSRHRSLLHDAQRLRGKIYLSDGAIESRQLTADGRHEQSIDHESWHLLALDSKGSVCGCVRLRQHRSDTCFRRLGVRESALATETNWGPLLQLAIEQQLSEARAQGLAFAEIGGWAVAPERRCTQEALLLALGTYALSQVLGGAKGITTATVRHHSSMILRRIGGRSLQADGVELPKYYDPRYRCEMEILQFDSRMPGEGFADWLEQLRLQVPAVSVVCTEEVRDVPQWLAPAHLQSALLPLRTIALDTAVTN